MYVVLAFLLSVMGVSSLINDRLPWSRRVGRYKIELVPLADEEYRPKEFRVQYPSDIRDVSKRIEETNQREQEYVKLAVTFATYQNNGKKLINNSLGKPEAARALSRYVRTYKSRKEVRSPITSFISDNLIKLQRRKRKKKRKNVSVYDPNLNIYVSIGEPRIIGQTVSWRQKATDKDNCTCGPVFEPSTKVRFVLTPCECEADYEIADPTDVCEEVVEAGCSEEDRFCEPCETTIPEITCKKEQIKGCCELDPIPKHTVDECQVTVCQLTQCPDDSQDDSPYKTYPFSGCKSKKKGKVYETTVGKNYEPDLRQIFSLPGGTSVPESARQHSAAVKKIDRNAKNKFKRRFSKSKRKNGRVSHFKRKETPSKSATVKNITPESTRQHVFENILSRIRGRANKDEITSTEKVINKCVADSMKISEETEDPGCLCTTETESTSQEKGNTLKTNTTVTNEGLLDEILKKLICDSGNDTLNSTGIDSFNKDESVTLIINVEDEVIAPPARNHSMPHTNPLSIAVEEMLAVVKEKMTGALGTTTSTTPTALILSDTSPAPDEIRWIKNVKHTTDTTVDPVHDMGIVCTNCFKFNYAHRGDKGKRITTEEPTALSETDDTITTQSITTQSTIMEVKTIPETVYTRSYSPVTDEDYDQIMSSINCSFAQSQSTVDLLKQICDNYKNTPSIRKGTTEQRTKITDNNVDYETVQCTEICETQKTRRQSTKSGQGDADSQGKEGETTIQTKISHSTTRKDETSRLQESNISGLTTRLQQDTSVGSDQGMAVETTTNRRSSRFTDRKDETTTSTSQPAVTSQIPKDTSGGLNLGRMSETTQPKTSSHTDSKDELLQMQPLLNTSIRSLMDLCQQHRFVGNEDDNKDETTSNLIISHHTDLKGESSRLQSTTTPRVTTHLRIQQSNKSDATKVEVHSDGEQTICFRISDLISECSTERSKSIRTSKVTKLELTEANISYYPPGGETTLQLKDVSQHEDALTLHDQSHAPPRSCNCTPPHPNRHHTFFFHHHHHPTHNYDPTVSYNPLDQTDSYLSTYAVEEENPDIDIKVTHKTTKNKQRNGPTRKTKHNETILHTEKPSKFRFYPPLSLYRTWLSPWAAVQIKQQPPHFRTSQINKYDYNNNDMNMGQDVITYPRNPFPMMPAMSQVNMFTTDTVVHDRNNGKAKGVYVGAIIVGNKYLPAGFYKLDDLKKLKNSGIPIPQIRGKKTIGYSVRRLVPRKGTKVHIKKNSRKSVNIFNNKNGEVMYSLAKLSKGRIRRKVLDHILENLKSVNL